MKLDFSVVIPAARAGDKAARDQLMAHFYAWSVTQARAIIRDSETAKDVALGFWEWLFTKGGIEQYDPAKGAFYPWMVVCLRRRARDTAEKKALPVVYYSEVSDSGDFSPDLFSQLSALQDLEAVAGKLRGATEKDVFWRMIEGATAQDIAEELGLSPKRVRNVIGEIRALIRSITEAA